MIRTEARPGRALVCAPVPPEYDRESGSRRIYHLVEFLLEAGWTVAFVCENAPRESRHLRHLRQRGVATYVGFEGPTSDLIEAGQFDLAIFAFWYVAHRHADMVRRLSPNTRIIVETIDLHWLRSARRILGGRDNGQRSLDEDYGGDLVAEINAYARADAVLTVSRKEADLVNDIVGAGSLAQAVPDCDETPPSEIPFGERKGILFVGNFRHLPNVDAVRFLCHEILPLLNWRLRDEHPLTIVGTDLDERVTELAWGIPDVNLVGWVPSLEPYLHSARVTAVPLRYGAGTKRKLIQALLSGTPTVATPAGAEGMDLLHGRHLLVAEDAAGFAAYLEQLLSDEDLWARMVDEGRGQILKQHGRDVAQGAFQRVLEEVMSRPARVELPPEVSEESDPPGSWSEENEAVRRAVREALPPAASVLVVSKGDPDLMELPAKRVRHFPQGEDGGYAGYHPRDSRVAIQHLSEVRDDAEYLLLPSPSFWWLDYYSGFARHLAFHHEEVWSDDACVIYRLLPTAFSDSRTHLRVREHRSRGTASLAFPAPSATETMKDFWAGRTGTDRGAGR